MFNRNQVIKALLPLGDFKESGSQLKYNCPVCEANGAPDNKFNLEVNYEKNAFHCWAHGYKGTIFKLVTDLGIKELASLFKVDRSDLDKEEKQVKILELPEDSYTVLRNKEATAYLINQRGLTKEQIKQRSIKWCYGGRQKNCIIFPSYGTNGALNYFVSHNLISKKYYKCSAPNNICFYESFIDRRAPVIVTEGVYDALVVPNALPCLGAALTETALTFLANCNVILAFDSFFDKKLLKKSQADLKALGCNVDVLKIPVDYDDLNEIADQNKPLLKQLLLPYYNQFV